MTATNHALTGTFIGLIIGRPEIALPIALLSHFVCDALPHYKTALPDEIAHKTLRFRNYLIAEAMICLGIVALLAWLHPTHWQLASLCAFVAAAPDLLSVKRYWRNKHGRSWRPTLYGRFAGGIQWFERPVGVVVELAWFVAAVWVILPFLR